ncbi:MAG: hypothetical protein QOE28_806, partial [Solirubrobacteraceae bacterium]|nr:hypothetical protein [Solirubrobacteraceae bacterium]
MKGVTTAPLNLLDELYLHLDRDDEPWSVQLEAGVEGRLDPERLGRAIVEAARAHPMARARLRRAARTDVRYHWEIADELEAAPLELVACEDDAALAAARERSMSTNPPLDEAPPFATTLAHHPGGDAIMLNLNHAAGDGMSALRLMASILRAYAGEPDPPAPVDALAVRDIGDLVDSRSLAARLSRGPALVEQATRAATSPARIAADGADEARPGYGFELLKFDAEELRAVVSHRSEGATVNDVLLGALAVTIRRWNDDHGGDRGRIGITMPVNLRPPEWRTEVLGNFASYVSVPLGADEQGDLPAATAAAAARTRRIKDDGTAGLVIDLLELPTAALPTGLKRRFQDLITLTGDRFVDTAVLSNLGRLDPVPELDADAG